MLVSTAGVSVAAVTFTDINPDTSTVAQNINATSGGRVNGMAVAPGSNQVAYAASEWGGIYKTTDGGANWVHLDGHLPQATWEVAVDPTNANQVYATSFYDGRVASVSGIQVSSDAGATWTHPATATPPGTFNCPAAQRTEPSAFGVAVRPDATTDVYVGTNCGVAISTDTGATWTFIDPTPATAASTVWDVVVQAGGTNGIVDICGQDGHLRSTDGGATWTGSTTNTMQAGQCSLAASPLESGVLIAVTPTPAAGTLWEGLADNAGVIQWTALLQNQNVNTRIEFVTTNQTSNTAFDIYLGGQTSLWRITGCDNSTTPTRCPTNTIGTDVGNAAGAHADPGDLVFDQSQAVPRCPLLYSNDGGIYSNASNTAPGCLNPTWNRAMTGLHATWLWAMDGATLAGPNTGIYFGLQDDGFWGTADGGANWANPECCDVFDVATDGTTVVYTLCCFVTDNMGNPINPSTVLRSRPANNPAAAFTTIYNNATPPPSGWNATFQQFPSIESYGAGSFVFVTQTNVAFDPAGGNGFGGVFVTTNTFGSTTQLTGVAPGPATPPNACGVQPSVSGGTPTFFVLAGNCGGFGGQLWSYTGAAAGGTWTRADTGLTAVGVFGVDPNDPTRLYASDLTAGGPRMVFSTDGGATWNPDTDLDAMMTQNGTFKYQTLAGPTNFTGFAGYPQPYLVAYDPLDGDVIVAGGRNSGVFISTDGGLNWTVLTDPATSDTSGVPHLPRPQYAYFEHQASGQIDVYIGTIGRGVWRISLDPPPIADANGPYATIEGTNAVLDAGGSSDSGGGALTYDWDFDGDGQFDDASGVNAVFDLVGQDGVFDIALRVTDSDGLTDVDTTTVTVDNVPPSVSLASDAPVDENSPVTVTGTITDPGWLDPLTATIDWGVGAGATAITGTLENTRPDATFNFSVSHTYGDDGTFTAEVCGSDDDVTTCETIDLQVDNVDPTAEIDESETVDVNGMATFIAHVGEDIEFNGRSTDPGSDDLDLSWDWDDGPPSPDVTTTYLVDPPNVDPDPSPEIDPRDVTDTQTHAFADACLYVISFIAEDDDDGSASDSSYVIIVGNADASRTAGYWRHQMRQKGKVDFDEPTLLCYLEIAGYMSLVFDEVTDASMLDAAKDVLKTSGSSGSMEEIFDRQLLAAWLNFANGAIEYDELVDTDGDSIPDTAFADAMATAESVRLNPAATRAELEAQKNIMELINTRDE